MQKELLPTGNGLNY